MPIQAPQWTDYLNCPVCTREFGAPPRSPISLGCGHTLCRHCLNHLHRKQCPFDQTVIHVEPEELVVNTALLQLAGYAPPAQPYHPPCIQALPEHDSQAYDVIVRCMEHLAVYLKYCGNANNSNSGSRLSRPMQRKLVTLLQCAITDEEGRGRAARAVRSLGERTVTELILQHQNPQQLSANLWAAVRARGCQFLGPAMQEEVLKLVLLALEDGSALSRKVLVMFVVQRLEPHFPQASKTSIGHVVQLLYRASCFKVSKRECDSSLMQLKEEFRTYESLRREHDAQIVQIATEAGLRIAPDQWSALLYGDTAHKSHMQSIIDKLQTPQSFAQSVQELFIALQRTGDPAQLVVMSMHLHRLAGIDPAPDAKSPTWQQLAEVMTSLQEVVSGLFYYLQQQAAGRDANHNQKHSTDRCEPSTSKPISSARHVGSEYFRPNHTRCEPCVAKLLTTWLPLVYTHRLPSPQPGASTPTHKYKVAMCRDAAARAFCPRGPACSFAHSGDELDRYRSLPAAGTTTNGNYGYLVPGVGPVPGVGAGPGAPVIPAPLYPRFPLPPPPHMDNYVTHIPPLVPPPLPPEYPPDAPHSVVDNMQPQNYPASILHNQPQLALNQNGMLVPLDRNAYYARFNMLPIHEETAAGPQYRELPYPGTGSLQYAEQLPAPGVFVHADPRASPYSFEEMPTELPAEYLVQSGFPRDRRPEPWPPTNEVFNFEVMRNTLPHCSNTPDDMFNVGGDRRVVGADRLACGLAADLANRADDQDLEEELQALERRFDTEFKSAD